MEIFSQGLFPLSWGRAWRHTRTGKAMLFGKTPASESIRLHFLDVEKSNFCRPWKFGKKQTLTLHQVCLYPSLNRKEVGEVRPVRCQSPGASISSFRAILGRGMGSVHTPGPKALCKENRLLGQKGSQERSSGQSGASHISHIIAPCYFTGANARSWEGLGEARTGQSSLSARALHYRTWAQIGSSARVEAHSVLPNTGLQAPAGSRPLLSCVPGTGLPGLGRKHCLELSAQGLVPLPCGCAREPK